MRRTITGIEVFNEIVQVRRATALVIEERKKAKAQHNDGRFIASFMTQRPVNMPVFHALSLGNWTV